MTKNELDEIEMMKAITENLVKQLGGQIASSNMNATHVVFFQKKAPEERLSKYRND
jgi:hypothetical protein